MGEVAQVLSFSIAVLGFNLHFLVLLVSSSEI